MDRWSDPDDGLNVMARKEQSHDSYRDGNYAINC